MSEFRFQQVDFKQFTAAIGTVLDLLRQDAVAGAEKSLPPPYPRIFVLSPSEAAHQLLDNGLWTWSKEIFLPHGTANDPYPELQPVFLAWSPPDAAAPNELITPPNAATILLRIDGAGSLPNPNPYTTIIDVFDRQSEGSKQAARGRFRAAKSDGHKVMFVEVAG
ncbi:MAG: DNA polymerase III subunit chi [Alphaproteobacteria bacterium]|nr:DNA polymerase III subunit chi [Alphaproteobacteria bacterium]